MDIKNWEEEFNKRFNHDNPYGVALVIVENNSQRPAQHELIAFITQLVKEMNAGFVDDLKSIPKGEDIDGAQRDNTQALHDLITKYSPLDKETTE